MKKTERKRTGYLLSNTCFHYANSPIKFNPRLTATIFSVNCLVIPFVLRFHFVPCLGVIPCCVVDRYLAFPACYPAAKNVIDKIWAALRIEFMASGLASDQACLNPFGCV